VTDATLGAMNISKRERNNFKSTETIRGSKIPFESIIKNYRIKQPKEAFERIRYWDEGRKYDLLRCTTTLAYEKYEYLQHLASLGELEEERIEQNEDILALAENSSISNSINSSGSSHHENSISKSTSSGATSISGVKTYQQLKKELFDWFKISRGPTLQKLSQDDLFESAILFFRNSRIRNPELKIQRDRQLLDQIISDINSNRTRNETLEATNEAHDLLAGCGYVSPNQIPTEIRQKPAPAKFRNLGLRFKDEVEILCDMFILRKVSRKRKLVQTDENQKLIKKKEKNVPTGTVKVSTDELSIKELPGAARISSLSSLLD